MKTVSDLFKAFGGPTSVARILGVGASTASEMKRRGSVPVEHWPALVEAAAEKGLAGVSPDGLMRLHARKLPRRVSEVRIAS